MNEMVKVYGSRIEIEANTLAEAKQAIKELKLLKKGYAIKKRELGQQIKLLKMEYKPRMSGPKVRGGGWLGKTIRAGQDFSRYGVKSELERRLKPLLEEQHFCEYMSSNMDKLILQMEAHLLQCS